MTRNGTKVGSQASRRVTWRLALILPVCVNIMSVHEKIYMPLISWGIKSISVSDHTLYRHSVGLTCTRKYVCLLISWGIKSISVSEQTLYRHTVRLRCTRKSICLPIFWGIKAFQSLIRRRAGIQSD